MTERGRLQRILSEPPLPRDGLIAALVGLVLRLAMVGWAAGRIAPTADGAYYHIIAKRIAAGDGYTWLWPDGAVTYAAHYPVGYPAVVGALYAAFGAAPWTAMLFNAALGAAAVWAVHRVASSVASRGGALLAALAVALHPALVAYTPAIMTEGVTAALWAIAAALAVASRDASGRARAVRVIALGAVVGMATLVRPQSLLLAPALGWLAYGGSVAWQRRALQAAFVSAVAVATCIPWTLRNCVKMERCVFVSANGGWNLLIGTAENADGGWVPLERAGVPPECVGVFGEASKDACYGRAARDGIFARPLRWLALAPRKLAVTFDYAGAAGWYLHAANPSAFTDRHKFALGVLETVWQRVLLALSLVALARVPGKAQRPRMVLLALAAPCLVLRPAWLAYLALVAAAGMLGARRLTGHMPAALAALGVFATAAAHAVFFGSGRYSLVVMPLVAALAGCALGRRPAAPLFDTDARGG